MKFTDMRCDSLPSGDLELKAFSEFLINENKSIKEKSPIGWKYNPIRFLIRVSDILPQKEFNLFFKNSFRKG